MNKKKSILWGIVLVAAGILYALKVLELVQFRVFFDGWWTLFLIIPCTIGLFTEREKTGNIIGLAIGAALLLSCQNVISFRLLWKLLVPAIIVVIGIRMILGGLCGKTARKISAIENENHGNREETYAVFSGANLNYEGRVFAGTELSAVFGGIKCDLRGAVIEEDCVIKVSAIFGGIDILVPETVNVQSNTMALFGGVSNKTPVRHGVPTVYVTGTCMFGGVDIK